MSSFSIEASILTFSVIFFSYLLGSIPFGILVSKVFGLGNLRDIGSGNIGATNVLRTGNKLAALITLIFDGLSGDTIGNGGFDSEGNYIGTSDTFSNAFEVLFDGTTTIAGDLSINSDARLKANIISLGSTLAKLLQIDGKSYTMKKDENKKQKIGVLAQDIEKVFPELVSESNGVKSVNYQGLVPVLINALKEQDGKMKEQDDKISRLEVLVEKLMSDK